MFGWFSGNAAAESEDAGKAAKPGFHPVELPASPRPSHGGTHAPHASKTPSLSPPPPPPPPATHVEPAVAAPGASSSSADGTLFGGMALASAPARRRRAPQTEPGPLEKSEPGTPAASSTQGEAPFFAKASLVLDVAEPAEAAAGDASLAHFRQRLEAFFREYCPSKLPMIDQLAEEFVDDQEALMQRLVAKHGPEPFVLQAADLPGGGRSAEGVDVTGKDGAARASEPRDDASLDRAAPSVSGASAFSFVSKAGAGAVAHTLGAAPSTPSAAASSTSPSPSAARAASLAQEVSRPSVVPAPPACARPAAPSVEDGTDALRRAQDEVAHRLQGMLESLHASKAAAVRHADREKAITQCVEQEAYEEADAAHREAEEAIDALKTALLALAAVMKDGFSAEKDLLHAGLARCVDALQHHEGGLLAVQAETIATLEASIADGDAAMDGKMEAHAVALQKANSALEESSMMMRRINQEASAQKAQFKVATTDLVASVESLTDECDALQTQIRELEDQLESLRAVYDGKTSDLSSATKQHEDMEDAYEAGLKGLADELTTEQARQASAVEARQELAQTLTALEAERVAWEARKVELAAQVAACKSGAATAGEQRIFLTDTYGPLLDALLASLLASLETRFEGHGVLYTVPLTLLGDPECRAVLERPSPLARQVTLQRDQMVAHDALSLTRQLLASLTARTTEHRTRVPVLLAEKDSAVAGRNFKLAKEKTDEIHRVQSTITAGEEELADLANRLRKEEKRAEHITTALNQEKVLSRGRILGFLNGYQQTLRKGEDTLAKLRSLCDTMSPRAAFVAPELVDVSTRFLGELAGEANAAEAAWNKSQR